VVRGLGSGVDITPTPQDKAVPFCEPPRVFTKGGTFPLEVWHRTHGAQEVADGPVHGQTTQAELMPGPTC
jgi:hypothetical protein